MWEMEPEEGYMARTGEMDGRMIKTLWNVRVFMRERDNPIHVNCQTPVIHQKNLSSQSSAASEEKEEEDDDDDNPSWTSRVQKIFQNR